MCVTIKQHDSVVITRLWYMIKKNDVPLATAMVEFTGKDITTYSLDTAGLDVEGRMVAMGASDRILAMAMEEMAKIGPATPGEVIE